MQTDAADMITRYHVQGVVTLVATALNFYIVRTAARKGEQLIAMGMCAWYAAVLATSYFEPFFQSPHGWADGRGDLLGFIAFSMAVAGPPCVFFALFQSVPSLRQYITRGVPVGSLVSIHALRLFYGMWFVVIYLGSKKHDNFFFIIGSLDVVVGTISPYVGLLIHMTGVRDNGFWVKLWNRMGLSVSVFSYGLLILNFAGIYDAPHPLSVVGFFPLSIVFMYLYPINIMTHLLLGYCAEELDQQFKKD